MASLGPAHGSLHFPTLLRPASQPPLFRGSLRRRLRMPVWSQDTNCTLCGHVMDEWSDHALASRCGGDRVTRDNLTRDVVHSAANDRANVGTVLEKPGLLILRNPVDDDRSPDPDHPDPSTASHRPADVWVPRGRPGGAPEAWDFSITSASRMGPALADPTAIAGVFASVESRKNTFLNTAAQCTQAGFTFCPLVLWEVVRRCSLSCCVDRKTKRSGPTDVSDASFKIGHRISCTLQRQNTRAILKRAPEQMGSHCRSLGLSVLAESELM